MNDREQIWKIVADFTSLTRQSNAAAKAVRNLEEARAKASSADSNYEAYDKEVASLDKLSASLKEAAKERRANASAIKREKEAEAGLLTGVGRRKQSIDAATTSTRNNTSATTQNTSAVQDNARSLDKSVAAQRYLNLVMQEGVRHKREHASATRDHTQATHESTRAAGSNSAAWAHNNSVMAQSGNSAKIGTSAMRRMNGENSRLTRSIRQTSASAIGLTGSLSVVNRAITDVGLVSRSWALVMKMLPLTAVTSAVNSLIPAINGLGGAFVGLVGSMGPVLGLLGALPTMAFAAAGAIGGLFAGLGGIFSTVSKWNKMQEAQSKAAIKATNKASTTDKSRAKSVRSTSRQIEKAYKDQAKARQGIADAEERLGDVIEDSTDRAAKAEKVLSQAQTRAKQATLGISAARKQAAKDLQDYRDKLKGGALDEEGAVLDLERARAALARVNLDPNATGYERRQADLTHREAMFRLDEIRKSNKTLGQEASTASKKGIEGSDVVVAAKQEEQDATEAVVEAQDSLNDTYKDNKKAIRDANRGVADANDAYKESGERISELKESLAELKNGTDDAATAAQGAVVQTQEYEDALAKLPPQARLVVKELIKLKSWWDKVSYSSQEAISPGLLSFLRDLQRHVLPGISDFLIKMAEGTGEWFRNLGKLLSKRRSLENLSDIFEDSYDLMTLLGEATLNVVEWLLGMGAAAKKSGLTRYIGEVIKSWTDGWKKLVNTPRGVENMAKSMETSMEFATLWGQAISETWKFLRKFFQGFRPLGKWMVENIRDTTKAWSEFLDSPDGANKLKVWQELAVINLKGVSDFIRVLTDQGKKLFDGLDFQKVWDAINGTNKNNGLLNAIGDILGIVDESMIVVVIEFATAILNILKQIGESGAMAAVIMLVDTFKGLADTASIIMKSFPIIANAVALLIAAFSAKKLLVAIGSLSDLKRILDAMNRSKINGNSVLAEFMGFGNLSKQTKPISFATGGKGSSDYGVSVGASGAGTQLPPGYFDSKSSRQKTSKIKASPSPVSASKFWFGYDPSEVEKDTGKLQKAAQSYEKSVGKVRSAWANVGTTLKTVVKGTGILLAVSVGIDLLTKLVDWATGSVVAVDDLRIAMEKSWQLKNFEDLDKVFEGSIYKSEGLAGALGLVAQASEDAAMAQKTGSTIWNKATRWLFGYTNTVDKTKDSLALMGDQLAAMPLDQAQGQFRLLAEEMANQGIATDDAVGLWGEYKTKIEEAFLAAGIATYTNEDLLLAMQGLHPEQDKINKALDKGAEFQKELNEQVETAEEKFRRTTEEISSQEDAIKSWNEAVDDAYGKARDLAEAEDDLARAQKDVNDRIKEMPDAKRTLDGNSTAALDNRDMLRDLAKEYETVIQSMIDSGAAPEEIAAKQAEFQKKFEGTLSLFDTGKKTVQEMATEMLHFPSQVNANIVVATPNLPPKDVEKLNDILRGLPPYVSSEVALDGMANGLASAEELRKKLVALNDIEVTIPIGFGSDRKIVTFDSKDGKANKVYFPKSGLTMKADGGLIRGPGTNTSDSIPALLSDEEYVIRARSAKRLGTRTLDFINKTGQVPKFARGGSVRVRKLAKGGSAGSGGGLGPFFSQFGHIGAAFTSLGSGIGTWGSGFSSWWSRLWGAMNSIMSAQGTNLTTKMRTLNDNTSSLMGSRWKNTWEGAKDTSNRILRGIVDGVSNTSPSMRDAWTKFMSQMSSPISKGVSFVDSTLGKMVNKVAGFYGEKKTPFPLNIKIPGFDTGGWTGPGSRLQPAGIVHADEFVVKKSSRRKIEKQNPGLLDHLNRTGQVPGYAKGGRVLLQGKTFTPKFAQALTNAAQMAGEWFHITQGGFRPRTSYSGTSHQGDAVDITPVKQKYVTALRKAGIAAWDRTGKGNWIPHIHGVPLPGYGSAAGSAIWQAQSYLRGGDGLGGRDNAPRQTPITGVLKGAKNILKSVGSGVASAFDFAKDLVGGFTSKLKEYFTGTQNKSPWEGVVGSVVNKVSGETSSKVSSWDSGFAGGGHTGDGPKHRVAGIVHKDEFVIKKSSRKKIERLAPGLLDYLNENGSLPGYAKGGKVSTKKTAKKTAKTLPSEYSKFSLFLSYLKKAESLRKKTQKDTKADKTWKHIKAFEWLLNYEGLLKKSAVNGVWGDSTTTAYKAWEKANKSKDNGKLDAKNVTALAKKYKAKVNTADPYTRYFSQPTSADYVVAAKMADNAKVSKFNGYLSTIKDKWKHSLVYDSLSSIGWSGIPDSYSGVKNPPNALAVAKAMAGNKKKSAAYESALKKHAPKAEPKGKPSSVTDIITAIEESNKQKTKFYGYLNQLRAQGFTLTYDELDKLGPNGIPEVFRDAVDPMSGIQVAEKLSKDKTSAKRYEEALKNAAKFEQGADALTSKLEEMNALIAYGPGSPYGLNTLAKELGISVDTAVSLFDKLNARGSFKGLSAKKTSRLRTDVAGFKGLFKFSKGGIVPGVGNTDSVFAMLTPGELVIPKDVVNSIFAPGVNAVSPPVTMSKMSSKVSSKTESTGNTYNFNTIVNNPVSEESSSSIQKRVRNLAHLGMFGE